MYTYKRTMFYVHLQMYNVLCTLTNVQRLMYTYKRTTCYVHLQTYNLFFFYTYKRTTFYVHLQTCNVLGTLTNVQRLCGPKDCRTMWCSTTAAEIKNRPDLFHWRPTPTALRTAGTTPTALRTAGTTEEVCSNTTDDACYVCILALLRPCNSTFE